ncbi:DNA repair protein RadA/Sms [Micrococcales bacterium KH10]|nr:DNA repair protein RadA/Sms [Micrococcales bacterium KH10]
MATSTAKKSAAKRDRPEFHCAECGWTTVKWVGRCGECQQWGTVVEKNAVAEPRTVAVAPTARPAVPIDSVEVAAAAATPTGVSEFDRVLGGGLVPGAVVLVAGEPGIGKSTLLLDVAGQTARGGKRVLYVTAEESAAQVRLRAERIGTLHPLLMLAAETDLGTILGHIEQVLPDLLIVDSVQTVASVAVEGLAGGVTQVREVTSSIIAAAKSRDLPVLLVGHVTKDGNVAGPRTLEHLVDVVCQFEGDRHTQLRLVRAAKNRYGATDEVGCFELTETGIHSLVDPSRMFISRVGNEVPGTCITVTLEGRRPLTTEIQALSMPTAGTHARRTTSGTDSSRLAMNLAVLDRHLLRGSVGGQDVYVSTVGGARASEPATDIAICLAVVSSVRNEPVQRGLVAFGEVGLSGDLRPVVGMPRRLAEAARLGFTHAVVPVGAGGGALGAQNGTIEIIEVNNVAEAVAVAIPPTASS